MRTLFTFAILLCTFASGIPQGQAAPTNSNFYGGPAEWVITDQVMNPRPCVSSYNVSCWRSCSGGDCFEGRDAHQALNSCRAASSDPGGCRSFKLHRQGLYNCNQIEN